ncbi:MAG: Restriction endonuclease [bacterium ADurb.Bin236]|nr:MAG: Restriction endonuclease [bacterium ADurb.Bin236]
MPERDRKAFVLRVAPSGIDRVPEAIETNEIIIGWSDASELIDESLSWEDFRGFMHKYYYAEDKTFRRSGGASGNIWKFIREMGEGDLVVVPHGPEFYVARVKGKAYHDPNRVKDDTAFRRPVEWLNAKKPIPRKYVNLALRLRMNIQNTCAAADDLIGEIEEVLKTCEKGKATTFEQDLQQGMVERVLKEIREGKISDRGFEELVAHVLTRLGARDVRIVPRNLDKGADVIGTFSIADTFKFVLAVQAKHYQPVPPVGKWVVDQLINGMQAESADLGWIVTSGSYSEETIGYASEICERDGIRIELIDGEQLAALIVAHGMIDRPKE